MSKMHLRKRQRISQPDQESQTKEPGSKLDRFSSLPQELLSEVLSYTSSIEVLAVARCSQYLCRTLLAETTFCKRIWATARQNCSLPEPTPNFTESSFAAFVFDGGYCEICGTFVKGFYDSFTLRLRLCDKESCKTEWRENRRVEVSKWYKYRGMQWRLPCHEVVDRDHLSRVIRYCRKSDNENAILEYKLAEKHDQLSLYETIFEEEEKRGFTMMGLCRKLDHWKRSRRHRKSNNDGRIDSLTAKIAEAEGWYREDLEKAPTFASLCRARKRTIEPIKRIDFEISRKQIESEVLAIMLKNRRIEEEQAYQARRKIISKFYDRLKSRGGIIPTLEVFRTMPVISTLQNKQGKSPTQVAEALKQDAVRSLLDDNVAAWEEATRRQFSSLLGYSNYFKISDKDIRPIDRLTALFKCTSCSSKDTRGTPAFALDFRGACRHACKLTSTGTRPSWSVDNFELDQEAIAATRKLLRALNVAEDNTPSSKPSVIEQHVMCLSCDGAIIMDFDTMKRHCHRHDDFKFVLLTAEQVTAMDVPSVEKKFCKPLRNDSYNARRRRQLRQYGCRQCIRRAVPLPQSPEDMASEERRFTLDSTEDEQLFSFDGLTCHLSAKHKVRANLVSDEDVYYVEPPSTLTPGVEVMNTDPPANRSDPTEF